MAHAGQAGDGNWRWAALAVLLLGLGLRAWALAPFDIAYSDELMQYLEQGNRLVTGHGIVPWEVRYGARNQLIPQLLAPPLWFGHRVAPGTALAVWCARGWYAALCALALPAAWRLGNLASPRHGFVALLVAATWWEAVLFSDLLLSESLGATLLLGAAALLLDEAAERRALAGAGLLLGLAVLVRLQYAPLACALALAALRGDARRWAPVLAGGALALAIGAASDLAAGRAPYAWIGVNIAFNLGSGRAARFGVEPWVWYLPQIAFRLGVAAAPFVLVLAWFSGPRYRPLLWAACAHLALHSLVAHKEYRFVWVSVLSLLVLAAIGSVNWADRLAARRGGGQAGPGAVALVALGWIALSLLAVRTTGGFAMERGGGAIPRLAALAAEQPGTCGIAVIDQFRAHVVPAMLPRAVPLVVAPEDFMGGRFMRDLPPPDDLATAANVLVVPITRTHREVPGYRRGQCLPLGNGTPVCLFTRPGPCTPASGYGYQRALEAEDL